MRRPKCHLPTAFAVEFFPNGFELMEYRLIVLIMLIVFFVCWQSSKNISTVVRHCIVALHPHSMRLFLMNFLVEIVLPERIVEMWSVVLSPELGV